jgi:hypothetical protein
LKQDEKRKKLFSKFLKIFSLKIIWVCSWKMSFTFGVKLGMLFKVSERSAEGYMSIINKWTEPWMKLHAGEIGRAEGPLRGLAWNRPKIKFPTFYH